MGLEKPTSRLDCVLASSSEEIAAVGRAGVLVVYGGWDAEMDVSLRARDAICESLATTGVDVATVPLSDEVGLRRRLLRDTRCVLNVANGPVAEGGPLIALRELTGLPFVGSPAGPSALALDKHATLLLARSAGLPVPAFSYLDDPDELAASLADAGLPAVAKPVDAGSSIDTVLCRTRGQLEDAVAALTLRHGRCLLCEFLPGREFSVGVVEDDTDAPVALPLVEVFPGDDIASTAVKYAGLQQPTCPAEAEPRLLARLTQMAVAAHTLLGLRGYSRADIRLDAAGIPRLMEVNHTPGLAAASWLPLAARAAGLTHRDLILRLLANALHRAPALASPVTSSSSFVVNGRCWVLAGGTQETMATARSAVAHLGGAHAGVLSLQCLPQWLTTAIPEPLVIEATYGTEPENAVVRAALDIVRARRTGPSVAGAALAEDKHLHRGVLRALGVPIPDGCLACDPAYPGRGPWVIKPRRGSQSVGVRLARTNAELAAALHDLQPHELSQWIVEEFIAGPEFVTGVLGGHSQPLTLPTLWLPVAPDDICTTETKALGARGTAIAGLARHVEHEITGIARQLHAAMGRPVLSRLDWRLERRGRISILEYDVFPGAGHNSYLTAAARAFGVDLATAVRERARICIT
ncbi:MAG: ATP-grasp domain-containing protein [Egibacteraceae bacterium]